MELSLFTFAMLLVVTNIAATIITITGFVLGLKVMDYFISKKPSASNETSSAQF